MKDLIERIEKAEAGSRELDAEIAIRSGLYVLEKRGRDRQEWFYPASGEGFRKSVNGTTYDRLDRFTTSVDAALTLIPNDFGFKIERPAQNLQEFGIPAISMGSAIVFYLEEDVRIKEIACANTVPLAICAAALRAREAQ